MLFPDPHKGTYILILTLSAPARLTIGRLGVFEFAPGVYAYVGSAFQAGGLRGRLKHHLGPAERPHWHIDYLRQAARVIEVWYRASERSEEHHWAAQLAALPGANIPAARFGASDCRCPAHLIYFAAPPDFDLFHAETAAPDTIQRWTVPTTQPD